MKEKSRTRQSSRSPAPVFWSAPARQTNTATPTKRSAKALSAPDWVPSLAQSSATTLAAATPDAVRLSVPWLAA